MSTVASFIFARKRRRRVVRVRSVIYHLEHVSTITIECVQLLAKSALRSSQVSTVPSVQHVHENLQWTSRELSLQVRFNHI